MNLYVVVEGPTEKVVYSKWIPLVNSQLREVDYVADISSGTFVIVQGGGMPQYFGVIESAIADVNSNAAFDRLVLCVDSEELTYNQKFTEVATFVANTGCRIPVNIVIQYFCFEAWALGNARAMPTHARTERLVTFRRHYDVSKKDPEALTPLPNSDANRAQTAESYLRAMLNAKWPRLTYRKGNPGPVPHESYLKNIRRRRIETPHIPSFQHFLDAFV